MGLLVFLAMQVNAAYAGEVQEYRVEADQYYQQREFKKAYKIYYKLAQQGDHYSQAQIAKMYTTGEGKKVDLAQAYAWSVLAAESGEKELLENSDILLSRNTDPELARKKAEKLRGKYGVEALQKKAELAEKKKLKNFGKCTGSRIRCS